MNDAKILAEKCAKEINRLAADGDDLLSDGRLSEIILRAIPLAELITENAKLKLQLKSSCCPVCWTNSWQPCDEHDNDAVKDPHGSGWMNCAMCIMTESAVRFQKENAELIKDREMLCAELERLRDLVGSEDVKIIDTVLEAAMKGRKE